MHICVSALLLLMLARTPTNMHIDHVMLGINDLDAGVRELEALTGVHAKFGGKHPGRGTQNALVSLGPETYLEIIAPQPGATTEFATLAHLTPVGFAVFASDVAAVRAELAKSGIKTTEPQAGSRATPAGTTLHWTTFGIVEPKLEVAPFFIRWDDLATHPAKTSPGGCTLVALDVTAPHDVEKLQLAPNISTHVGPEALALTFRCGERTIRFPR